MDLLSESGHDSACKSGVKDEQATGTDPLAGLKAKVAIAIIKGEQTIAQIAEHFDVHPNQVTAWKAQLEGCAADGFDDGNSSTSPAALAVDVQQLQAKIGELGE